MKRSSKLLSTVVLIGGLLIPVSVIAETPPLNHVNGKAANKLVGHYDNVSNDDLVRLQKLSDQFDHFKIVIGPNNSLDAELTYPALQGMVFVNGQEAQVDKEGNFSIDTRDNVVNIEIRINGKRVKDKTIQITDKNTVVDLVETKAISDFMQSMDKPSYNSQPY